VLDEAATADKEATDKWAAEEAVAKRATEEAVMKAFAAEEVASTTTDEDAEAARGSPALGQAPLVTGAKRVAVPSGSTPLAKRPYRGVWKLRFVHLSLPLFSFFLWLHSLITFLPRSSPSGAATATGTAAVGAAIGATLGPAPVSEPRTPEGVPEDVVESEGEPEVALEPVPEVVPEAALEEGAMIAVRMAAIPPPSRWVKP
jgi:hypothetical protein